MHKRADGNSALQMDEVLCQMILSNRNLLWKDNGQKLNDTEYRNPFPLTLDAELFQNKQTYSILER